MRLSDGLVVSVLVVRSRSIWKRTRCWVVEPFRQECKLITLVARCTEANDAIFDLHILPSASRVAKFYLTEAWLKRGLPITDLS